jgi:hypothetical protein
MKLIINPSFYNVSIRYICLVEKNIVELSGLEFYFAKPKRSFDIPSESKGFKFLPG